MPCKVTKPANPNGSSRERPSAGEVSEIETKRLHSSCAKQDREDIIIESQRKQRRARKNVNQDHIADRGHVSMSHNNTVHKPIPHTDSNEDS